MLTTFGVLIMLFINLSCASDSHTLQPQCYYRFENTKLVCGEIIDSSFPEGIAESTKLIVFTSDNLACDCALKKLLEWKETVQRSRKLTLEGVCFSPEKLSGRSVGELSSEEVPCVSESQDDLLVRKRRAVQEAQNEAQPSGNKTYTPGAPVLPCDFQEGFCQWFQLTDDEFHWTRNKGQTNSTGTGPDTDHTTGTVNGYYVYIESSLPRVQGHKARLVSPTLAPVEANSTCQMDLYIHMKGSHIGVLNIYQAPVVGFAVTKLSLTAQQGNNWFKKQIQFDSDREFQVIIEGVRGQHYQGDIAIDDISFTSGCMRLAPSFVRLVDGLIFSTGRVEIYHKGEWRSVCREGWDQASSSVACKELGFEKAAPDGNGGFPLQSDPFTGLYNVSCVGNEPSIKNCPSFASPISTSCPSNYSATAICSGILPVCPLETHFYCSADSSGAKKCISRAQICDFSNDCADGSDELNCGNYTRCDFNDSSLCGWIQASNDHMDWTRHKGSTYSAPYTGPTADHTGNRNAYYLYMDTRNRQGGEKARILVTPRFQGNNNGLCKMRFFYHMYGYGIGTLRVLLADRYSQRTLWSKSYQQNIDWTRAEVPLANMSSSFIVTFEGEHAGGNLNGDIAIDDVSFTPECRPAPHENVTCKAGTFSCGSGECIPLTLQCDFNDDCFDGTDEFNCGVQTPGRCDFETGLCHWQNMTDDDFNWQRFSGNTPSRGSGPTYDHTRGFGGQGHYMYIEASFPRKYGDKARLISTQFMWKNVANCQLRFYYHMQGLQWISTMGSLRVKLRNTITGVDSAPIWERSGHQGYRWFRANVPINTTWPVTQVIFEAERGLTYQSDIAIDDVSFSSECYPTEAVHVYKNYDVRLTDGKEGSFEGRVEIYRVGSWGTICDDGWGVKDAQVVCKQLGYADVKTVHEKSYFGEGKGRIWLDDLACYGNETNLGQCLHNGWGNHDCTHRQDAGVVCDKDGGSKTKAIRLRSNNTLRGGRVEIYRGGSWEAICFDEWDLNDAFVACRQLGYPRGDKITSENGTNIGSSLKNVQCNGHEDTLGDCIHDWSLENCNYGNAGVVCSAQGTAEGNIRLTGGSSEKEGRLEVFHQGEWGTVCDDLWTRENARVVCHELGFTSVQKILQSFGPGSGRVLLEQVGCHGNETALVDCPKSGWGVTSCTHREDVGVICSDQAYIGCYRDTIDHVMTLEFKGPSMTPVSCLRRCQSRGYKYAGLEWANECYCGAHYDRYGNSTFCNLPCYGDATKICGGPWSLSVYNTNPAIIPTAIPGQAPVTQSCTVIRVISIFAFQQTLTTKYFGGDHRLGWISSPNFPNTYQERTLCIWVVTLLPGTRVNITFNSFTTEYRYDTVKVRDGEKHYSQLLSPSGGFSGVRFTSLEASSNVMWIQFSSDSTINQQGFNLTYRAIGVPTAVPTTNPPTSTLIPPSELPSVQMSEGGCNGISHSVNTTFGYLDWYHSSGFVRSPGYPSKYPDNLVCRWSVRVAPGYRIRVTVKYADIAHAAQSGGLGDTLQVDDGVTRKTSHEQSAPWEFLSAGDLVRVIFITDAVNSGNGFYLQYERVNVTEEAPSSSSSTCTSSIPVQTSTSSQITPAVLLTQASTSSVSLSISTIQATSSSNQVQLTQTSASTLVVSVSSIQATGYANRVPSSALWTTTKPAEGNTIAQNKGDRDEESGMGGGTVAAIVVPLLIAIVVIIVVVVCLMKKKKRVNRGVRHQFVNEEYDNFDAMAMTPTTSTVEYANPIAPNGSQTAGQSQPDQGPIAYYAAAAPPPYSQATNGGIYLVPFVAAPGERMTPMAFDNPGYASLQAPPPAYQALAPSPANRITTTGIGSVTSLREAAKDDGYAAPTSAVTTAYAAPSFKAVLPPIRGTYGAAEPERKQPFHEDEAGPLPEKPPLTVNTPPEPTAPPRPPSARSQIRLVTPVTEPEPEFDVEVPFEFLCPLSNKIMQDPVTASDGYNYEREAICHWFRKKRTSPMTNGDLTDLTVRTNDELRKRIEQFTGEHSQARSDITSV